MDEDYKVKMLVPEELKWDREKVYGTRVGNTSNIYERYNSSNIGDGNVSSGSTARFELIPGSNILTDSTPVIEADLTIEVENTGTATTANHYSVNNLRGALGTRPMALNRSIKAGSVAMNGSTRLSSQPAEHANAVLYSLDEGTLERLGYASVPDYNFIFDNELTRDPLKPIEDSATGNTRGLGATKVISVIQGDTNKKIIVNLRLSERLMLNPFQWFKKTASPFVGINKMDVSLSMVSDFLKSMVNFNKPTDNDAIKLQLNSATLSKIQLVFRTHAPSLQIEYPLKAYWDVPYIQETIGTTSGHIPINGDADLEITARNYDQVPKAWMLYAVEEGFPNDIDVSAPVRYYPITDPSVNLGSKRNQFQSWSVDDLLLMSKKNGYNGLNSSFFGVGSEVNPNVDGNKYAGTGCVIIFTPSDMDTEENVVSNANLTFNFSVKAKVHNNDQVNAKKLQLRMVSVEDGILSYYNGRYSEEKAGILPNDLAKAELDYYDTSYHQNVGNGFLSNLWHKAKKIAKNPLTKELSRVVRNLPYASDYVGDNTAVGRIAKQHGYGKKKGGNVISVGGREASNLDDLLYR